MGRKLLIVLVSCFLTAMFSENSFALTFSDDFESYPPIYRDLINGKPNWESSDTYYSKGWIIYETSEDGTANTPPCNVIMFAPSPWTGGFSFNSNWAIYHVSSLDKIGTLSIEVYYNADTNGAMKTYISGDKQVWVDVTEVIGMISPSGGSSFKKASGDLTAYIPQANITSNVYVKFTSAAYSGSAWGSSVNKITIDVEKTNTPPVVDAGENKIINSSELPTTVIEGSVFDPDNDPLNYRWLVEVKKGTEQNDVGEYYYEPDFSSDRWETNNTAHYHWDSETLGSDGNPGVLYTSNYTNRGEYATVPISYNGGDFTLEFDLKIIDRTTGDICVGLFGAEKRSHSYSGERYERVFMLMGGYLHEIYLEAYDQNENQVLALDNPPPDYYNNRFADYDDKWYHFKLVYDATSKKITVYVTPSAGEPFTYNYNVTAGFSSRLVNLGVSMNGSWVTGDRWQAVYMDNLKFSTFAPAPKKVLLPLGEVLPLRVGDHEIILEGSDSLYTVSDKMVLTINNSSPVVVPSGTGTYQYGESITLGGTVSDYDGDVLEYKWLEGSTVLTSGSIATEVGGYPVKLADYTIPSQLSLGVHTLTLEITDNINPPILKNITVEVIDSVAPTLAPTVNPSILWPPNHQMVPVEIYTNAKDNTGASVALSALVTSSEPPETSADGNTIPDYTVPQVNQSTGVITLELRAERQGKGAGRTYTITIIATDASNNTSQAKVEVIAPHDRGK